MEEKKPILSKTTYHVIDKLQNVIAILLILLLVSQFGVSVVPTGSMLPTLQLGEEVIYHMVDGEDLDYGDVAMFFPQGWEGMKISSTFQVVHYVRRYHMEVYIKRVVGLPGDVLEVRDGSLWRNGERLDEPYVPEGTDGEFGPYTVPEGYLFCMGDNRNNSYDCRWLGPMPYDAFFGQRVVSFCLPWANPGADKS